MIKFSVINYKYKLDSRRWGKRHIMCATKELDGHVKRLESNPNVKGIVVVDVL